MSKERPILFSADMVNAISAGRKTQTRRVVKGDVHHLNHAHRIIKSSHSKRTGKFEFSKSLKNLSHYDTIVECPYGEVGDRLWVRESWRADDQLDHIKPSELRELEPIYYEADGLVRIKACHMIEKGKLRPSIYMPRWASRILLEITDVRVERLQDISEEDAKAEGIKACCEVDGDERFQDYSGSKYVVGAKYSFQTLWESINGKSEDKCWDANPWVWVVEFKRVDV